MLESASRGGLPGPGGVLPGRGRGSPQGGLPGPGGSSLAGGEEGGLWGGLPGPGGSAWSGGWWSGIPACTEADTLPLPVDRQTPVKTLPWPQLRCGR